MTRPVLPRAQFGNIGIFLLRHQRRAGGVGVGDFDEIKFRARPENHILGEPRQMNGEQRCGGGKFDGEIAVADGVHGILRELRFAARVHEAEQFGDEHTVERQSGTGNRTAAERADVRARAAVPEALAVAFEHLDVGEQMMREINRLRALQMRVAGNEDVGIFFSQPDECALQPGDFAEQHNDFVPQPETHVECDLVVARAPGVELGAGGTRRVSSVSMFM